MLGPWHASKVLQMTCLFCLSLCNIFVRCIDIQMIALHSLCETGSILTQIILDKDDIKVFVLKAAPPGILMNIWNNLIVAHLRFLLVSHAILSTRRRPILNMGQSSQR